MHFKRTCYNMATTTDKICTEKSLKLLLPVLLNQVKQGIRPVRRMSVFTKKLNPWSGAAEWVLQDENYDFHQEIARSSFADMLHDSDRNDKYYAGIKAVIEQTHRAGKKAHVLDIGTGTGLLAMMAARCGADTIYACEAFSPISECAEKVIRDNKLSNRIQVIHKRSTDMTAGEGGDMPHRANILVTEVFDTELIGEGAVCTFNHAHKHLLEKDCLVVPSSATVYAQVVESSWLQRWNRLSLWGAVRPSRAISSCPGAAAVHDLQINQINRQLFKIITPPQKVFRFDWSGRLPIPENDATTISVTPLTSGNADSVFMWWSLNMDPEGTVVLSCAPMWAHPSSGSEQPWRDHWMQAVYYLPSPRPVTPDSKLKLLSNHDEFSLWFNVSVDNKCEVAESARPVCDCMLHVSSSRTRLGMLNDPIRRAKYLQVLTQLITTDTVVLSWGDTSLLGLMAATLNAQHVFHVEENAISREVIEELVKDNNLTSKVTILDSAKLDDKVKSTVTLVVGEPFFSTTINPWDSLRWWFLRQQCPNAPGMPVAASLHGLAVQFEQLHKIRAPLGTINGFSMAAFDDLIHKSSSLSDNNVEAQPLWEYQGVPLSSSHQLMTFDLANPVPENCQEVTGVIPYTASGTCHGVALWMDWHLDADIVVSTGPQQTPCPLMPVVWDHYSRQGVYFFPTLPPVTPLSSLNYRVVFNPLSGEIFFNFTIK